MSEDIKKQLDAVLSKMASMESELSGFRKANRAPTAPQFDIHKYKADYLADPVGAQVRLLGLTPQEQMHVTRVHFAHAMGKEAPLEMQVLAQMGPQISATSALTSELQTLRQRVESFETRDNKKATRESFSALAKNKEKYPHLAEAYAADPTLFEGVEEAGGDVSEIAATLETRHAKLAGIYRPPQPASEDDADDKVDDPSTQVKLAPPARGMDPTPPIATQRKSTVWTQEDHDRERDAIVRKYSQKQTA